MKRIFKAGLLGPIALGIVYVGACIFVARDTLRRAIEDKITIRVAHDNLHQSMRAAWAEAKRQYEQSHPNVRIEILEVPNMRDFYNNTWTRTQLIGGTAPDLMKVSREMSDADLAEYFRPLTQWMDAPNPFNADTAFSKTKWRDTFLDGLSSRESLPPTLLEIYRVPLFAATSRIYYNRDIFREVFGADRAPATFEELATAAEEIRRFYRARGRAITPIAGGDVSLQLIFNPLFAQQTQRLALQEGYKRSWETTHLDEAAAYLLHKWDFTHPAARQGLDLIRRIGREMQPGFLQMRRDDMSLLFQQQNAAMIPSGSWDASYFLHQLPFPVGVFTLPLPTQSDGRKQGVLGPLDESQLTDNGFGVTRTSQHPSEAVDFLRFLTSQPGNQAFCETGERIPSIVGARPAQHLAEFTPNDHSWPWGFTLDLPQLGGRWAERAVKINLHRLFAESGSVEDFLESFVPAFDEAVHKDAAFYLSNARNTRQRSDSVIVGLHSLANQGDHRAAEKLSRLFENQNWEEAESAQLYFALQSRVKK